MAVFFSYPLLLPLASLMGGILMASRTSWKLISCQWAWVGVILGGVLLIKSKRSKGWQACWIFLFFFFLGMARLGDRLTQSVSVPLSDWVEKRQEVSVLLQATSYCEAKGKRSRFKGKLLGWYAPQAWVPQEEKILWTLGSGECSVSPGHLYRSLARFNLPGRFQNPSSLDYPRQLRSQGIRATAFIKNQSWLVSLNPAEAYLFKLRGKMLSRIQQNVVSVEAQGILEALFLREKRSLTSEVESVFRRTGLSHLLVVSGLHLGLVYLWFYFLIYGVASWIPRGGASAGSRRFALMVACLPTALYGGMVGGSPSVLRAMGMVGLAGFAGGTAIRKNPLSLVFLIAFFFLLMEPGYLFQLSFQLSFLAVTAILLLGKSFSQTLQIAGERFSCLRIGVVRYGANLLMVTVGVQLALLPLLAQSFHQVSLVAPLTNLLAVPLFTFFILPALLLAGFLDILWAGAGRILIFGIGELTQVLYLGLQFLAKQPGSIFWLASLSLPQYLAWALSLILLFNLTQPKKVMACLLGIFFLLFAEGFSQTGVDSKNLSLTAFDVGQGESLLVELPQEGEALLIDGGGLPYGDFDLGERILLPELLERGIRKLRAVVLTHPDADHWKGLNSVLENLEVEEFWVGRSSWEQKGWEELKTLILKKKIPVRFLLTQNRWVESGVEFEVLWPRRENEVSNNPERVSRNNQSLVLRLCLKEICYLLTGDLEGLGEAGILETGRGRPSQVLKVAHHGSRTSSTELFLDQVQAQWALISAGQKNRFGFPHEEVLKRLKKRGVKILRTDLHGQASLVTDGFKIWEKKFTAEPIPNR